MDREQVRRDAEQRYADPYTRIARYEELVELLDAQLEQAERELEGYRSALVAHHNLANVSDAVIERYDWRECPVCKEARGSV